MTRIAEVRGNLSSALRRNPALVSQIAQAMLDEVPPEGRTQSLSPELEARKAESVRFWRGLGVRRSSARAIAFAEVHYRRHLATMYGDEFMKRGVIRLRGHEDGSVEIILIRAASRH